MKKQLKANLRFGMILILMLIVLLSSCVPSTAEPVEGYLKMNPPPDSDKPLPVPAGNNSCYLHTAANMLAGAGYGTGSSVQARAVDIFGDLSVQFGVNGGTGGWADAAAQWWLDSANNTWTSNPYTLITVYGNKTRIPWANANGAMDLANELRSCNFVGVSISWPDGGALGGTGGHAITGWGDDDFSVTALSANPGGISVADSDTDTGGDVQSYTYDAYNNPNPTGQDEGNGWYFNYGANHPFIKHIVTLSPTDDPAGGNSVRVVGSYRIQQTGEEDAVDLHYKAGTDVNILSYRTWLDWPGEPSISESNPRREITVDWDLSKKPVPPGEWVTISTEFIEPVWNAIYYQDVYFTYPHKLFIMPDIFWSIETPFFREDIDFSNITGGYVIGAFEILDPELREQKPIEYRFAHQYIYNQSPEQHTLLLSGSEKIEIANLRVGHSYGYPVDEELWEFRDWITIDKEIYQLHGREEPLTFKLDWTGMLPYPEGDMGN